MEAWREELYHGKEWKNHKYIRKEGNRYIYEEPKGNSRNKSGIGDWINNAANAVGNWVSTAARDVANAIDPKVVAIQTKLDKVKKEYSDFRGETSVNVYWKKREQLYNDSVKAITDLGATDGEARRLVDLAIVNDTNTINKILNNSVWYTKLSLTNKSKIDDILIPVIQMDKMSEWKEKDSAYKEEIKRLEEELESVKHSDTYTKELYHTAIGGTLIITRR